MWYIWFFSKLLIGLPVSFLCLLLVGCGDVWGSGNKLNINVAWYDLEYNWNVELWRVMLKTDDLNDIIELYQEVGDDIWYRDSLLIAVKNSQWLWVNAFAQDNLDGMEEQWLDLSDIKKTQIIIWKESEDVIAVLIEYKITGWLIDEIPLLYVSQLFIPDGYNIRLVSYITEDSSSHSSAVKMLKNIK